MTPLQKLGNRTRYIISIVAINLLLSCIGLFAYPGEWFYCFIFPWLMYGLAFIGYIPFAGFPLFYWLYRSVLLDQIWIFGTSWFTSALFWLYLALCVLRTLQSTARLAGNKEG